MKITYLGPAGATFSAIAYDELARLFHVPPADDNAKLVLARTNEEVLPLVLEHGGYGAIAMETKAQGRVDPPINSFIELLRTESESCDLRIIGATRIKLHFALMARPGMEIHELKKIVAHPKALGACRERVKMLGVEVIEASSNGKAAEDIARSESFAYAAALAPIVAAEKYSLNVLKESFEDKEAITTFFLLGPSQSPAPTLTNKNRALFVFRARHVPGSLVKILTPFAGERINLFHIHSLYTGNGEYDFAIETECGAAEATAHGMAIARALKFVTRSILFGPFPVLGV